MSTKSVPFGYPDGNPTSEVEFNRFMWALDKHLAEKVGQPLHRLMGRYIEDALWEAERGWGNSRASQSESAREARYTGRSLAANALQWYEQVYGAGVWGRAPALPFSSA